MTGKLTKHQLDLLVNALDEKGKVRTWAVKLETLDKLRDLGLIRKEQILKSGNIRAVLKAQVFKYLGGARRKTAANNFEGAYSDVEAAEGRLSELNAEAYFLTEEGHRVAKDARKS